MKTNNNSLLLVVLSALFISLLFVLINCDDDSDNRSIPVSTMLIMFNAGTHDGDLGGRSGADALCTNSANKPTGVRNIHALISTSDTDEIRDIDVKYSYPTTLPVYGPDGTSEIAADWTVLISSDDINMSFYSAGVMPSFALWTGSGYEGQFLGLNSSCDGFTSNDSGDSGVQGGGNEKGTTRWNQQTMPCNLASYYVLCIAEK